MAVGALSHTVLIYLSVTEGDVQLLSLPSICSLCRVFLLNERSLDIIFSVTSCLLYVNIHLFLSHKLKH